MRTILFRVDPSVLECPAIQCNRARNMGRSQNLINRQHSHTRTERTHNRRIRYSSYPWLMFRIFLRTRTICHVLLSSSHPSHRNEFSPKCSIIKLKYAWKYNPYLSTANYSENLDHNPVSTASKSTFQLHSTSSGRIEELFGVCVACGVLRVMHKQNLHEHISRPMKTQLLLKLLNTYYIDGEWMCLWLTNLCQRWIAIASSC